MSIRKGVIVNGPSLMGISDSRFKPLAPGNQFAQSICILVSDKNLTFNNMAGYNSYTLKAAVTILEKRNMRRYNKRSRVSASLR